jgi:hypothetical protein
MSYYDRDGQPLELREWSAKFEDKEYKRVALDAVGEASVSTVWLGLNHQWGDGPPLIFETMVFGGKHDEDQWRWSTEADALAGHERIVAALRDGVDPE